MYDLIIIGAGPAGLTAGLYAGRYRLKTILLEKISAGGRILLTERVENYPGFPNGILAQDLMRNMKEQVERLGIEITLAEAIDIDCAAKTVKTTQSTYVAKAAIIATGARPKKLGVPGEEKLTGKGVSYCATCDAPFFKEKRVFLVGGGDTVAEEALYLAKFCKAVTVVHRRDAMRASAILQERLRANKKIGFFLNSVVKSIQGEQKVESIRLQDLRTQKEQALDCDGVFIYIGYEPETEFLKGKISLDKTGFILADENMLTSCEGVFACGDCRKKNFYQVITACADGAIAAHSAYKYISGKHG